MKIEILSNFFLIISEKQNGEKDFTVGTPSHDAENEGKDCGHEIIQYKAIPENRSIQFIIFNPIYCTVAHLINFNKKYSTVGQSIIVKKYTAQWAKLSLTNNTGLWSSLIFFSENTVQWSS